MDSECFVSLEYWVRVIWVRQCSKSHTNQIHNRPDSSFQIFLEDLLLQAQERLQKVKHNGEKVERTKELREYKEGIERIEIALMKVTKVAIATKVRVKTTRGMSLATVRTQTRKKG